MLRKVLPSVARFTMAALLGPALMAVLMVLFLIPLMELVYETYELARMSATARALVVSGPTEPRLRYAFLADQKIYQGHRVFPGWLSGYSDRLLGYAVLPRPAEHEVLTIIYDPAEPSRCAIERGWWKPAMGSFLAIWGLAIWGRRNLMIRSLGGAGHLMGLGLLLFAPAAVRLVQWKVYTGALATLLVLVFVYELLRQRSRVGLRRPIPHPPTLRG